MKLYTGIFLITLAFIILCSCSNLTSSEEICHHFKASIQWDQNTNQLTAIPNGGDSPFFYMWSNGVGDLSTITVSSPGTYSVTVTDKGQCKAYASFTIK